MKRIVDDEGDILRYPLLAHTETMETELWFKTPLKLQEHS